MAEVTFDLTFEPGSKWFTEIYSDEARSAMESFFSGLGEIFDATATVSVAINDNDLNHDPFQDSFGVILLGAMRSDRLLAVVH